MSDISVMLIFDILDQITKSQADSLLFLHIRNQTGWGTYCCMSPKMMGATCMNRLRSLLTMYHVLKFLEKGLTDSDGLRGTFWPVKFWPPNFFMKSSLIYPTKHGEGKKSHLWAFWGLRGAKKPKSRNCHFWAKIFVFSYRNSSTT